MSDTEFTTILNTCMPEYRVVELIGSGNFGSVYKCERDGIYYAIKMITVPPTEKDLQALLARSDEDAVEEYLREKVGGYQNEIKVMSNLKGNRSIVNIEDYKIFQLTNSSMWYIVIRMELLTSLTEYTKTHALTEAEVISLGKDICDALTICEKNGIIHRDVKPENIMIHKEGAFKLGDFGIARQLSQTTTGTIAGTEGFMAPEVSRGLEYNRTADIYSLGIVLYYYLNNRKMPFVSPDDRSLTSEQNAIFKRLTENSILPPPPYAEANLARVIQKACMYDKEDRYQTAAEMRQDLERVSRGEPVSVILESKGQKGTIITKTPVIRSSEHPNTDTPFTGTMVEQRSQKQKSRQDTVDFTAGTKKKKHKGLTAVIAIACVALLAGGGFFIAHQLEEADKAASGTFLNEDGELVTILSKNEMEEAYELGVQYAAAGNYEEAIVELEKVTEKSRLFEKAQEELAQTRENYKNDLISKAQESNGKGNYENALTILDTGVAALGDNDDFTNARNEVLNTLKADYLGKAEAFENEESYDDAILAVQTALTFIPNDEELTGKITVLEAINAAEAALKNAEKYRISEDYVSLFATLDAAKKEVNASTAASSKIKLAYDSYKKEYLDSVKLKANTATTVAEYDDAVTALTTAAGIFTDDSELKTLQKDMTNMRTATKALNEADAYIGMKDYKNAFTVLSNAQDALPVGSVAYTKVKTRYDNTKTTFLNYIDEVSNNPQTISDYDEAINALDAASEIFPYESNLSVKKTTLTNMRTAKKAVEEADAYAAKEDYKNLFSTLQDAIDALSGASDARKIVEAMYEKYESSYMETLDARVGEPKTVNEYDVAISVLKSALIVFPNNIDIQNRLNTYEQECPVSLFSRPLISASRKYESGKVEAPEHSFQLNTENAVDNIENQYETASLISDGWGAFKDYFTTEAVFDCEGYNKLSGIVAISNNYKDAGGTHHFIIYGSGDGEKYTKLIGKDFTSGMRPWRFEEVDISKYSNIKIALKTDDGVAVSRLILADFTLWK